MIKNNKKSKFKVGIDCKYKNLGNKPNYTLVDKSIYIPFLAW